MGPNVIFTGVLIRRDNLDTETDMAEGKPREGGGL